MSYAAGGPVVGSGGADGFLRRLKIVPTTIIAITTIIVTTSYSVVDGGGAAAVMELVDEVPF